MEGCSKTSAGAASGLPDDPLVEILSRVPARSICRFKCVSKAWRDLIGHPDHRKKLRQAMQGLFVQTCDEEARISFSFIDLSVRSVPLDIGPYFSFLREMTEIETTFVDSCNGLVLFRRRLNPYYSAGYIVCNPTTRQWSAVPPCGTYASLNLTYLAFDPAVSSHFHLVEVQMPDVEDEVLLHVYSSETGIWSPDQIDEQRGQGHLEVWYNRFALDIKDEHRPAFVNGFLHLIVGSSDVQKLILAVDVQGKATRMITVPSMTDGRHEHASVCYFGQSQGQLHCMILESQNQKLSTWVLQDYDTQEWLLKNTVYPSDVFGETEEMPKFEVIDIHHDCNVVFFFHEWSCELIAYNMDRKEVSVIATFEDYKFRFEFARYIPCFSELPALTNKY